VGLLEEHGVKFESFNILEDDDVRQGLKKLSNWPTFPQVVFARVLVTVMVIVCVSVYLCHFPGRYVLYCVCIRVSVCAPARAYSVYTYVSLYPSL